MATRPDVEDSSASTPVMKRRRPNIPDTNRPCVGDRPNIKQLLELMRIKDVDITTRWRDLGLELVDSNKILKVIEANCRNDVDTCCREMFEKWLEMTPDASWNQLITGLRNIGMNTAADIISKQLLPENAEEFDGEMDHAVSGRSDGHFTVQQKDQSIQQKYRQIFQKDQQDEVIIPMKQQLTEKDRVIYEKDQLIKQKDKEIIEMEAKLKSSNVVSKVAAHFTADVELPPTWEVMPKDSSGKEIACHVVDLQPSDPEYQEVLAAITSEMPLPEADNIYVGPELDIVKIQRIQNPTLYAQYTDRKKTMEKENPDIQIERWLFHKCYTNGHSVSKNICNQGFNKSIAGPNCISPDYSTNDCMIYYSLTATFCGGGVPFVIKGMETDVNNAHYMTDESNRFMFYARVLTGDYLDCERTYLHNKERLRAPHVKNASKGTLYDSVVDDLCNPKQFAVFHNNQSYPDYLIKYTYM